MRQVVGLLALAALAGPGLAVTPMDEKLTAGGITRIECNVLGRPPLIVWRNDKGKDVPESGWRLRDLHYDLYLPADYDKNPDYRYPAIFIAAPGGNANMANMTERLKRDGWVAVMLVESQNGSVDVTSNFVAAYDDVVQRVRIAKGAKLATGLSGGSRAASMYPLMRPGFRGLFCQAAGFIYGLAKVDNAAIYEKYPPQVLVAGTFGTKDENAYEAHSIRRTLDARSGRYVELFDGGHDWAPAPNAERVFDWFEDQAFLAPPVAAQPCALITPVKAESMGPEGYAWFFRLTQQRLEKAETKAEKYRQMSRLPVIAKNGQLTADPETAKVLATVGAELEKLKTDPELQTVLQAEKEFQKAMAAFDAFEKLFMRGKAEFKKRPVSRGELTALDKFREAAGKVIAAYPDTYYAKRLQAAIDCLALEFN